jgi:hypothetical protein
MTFTITFFHVKNQKQSFLQLENNVQFNVITLINNNNSNNNNNNNKRKEGKKTIRI